jgi:hypothetical protein
MCQRPSALSLGQLSLFAFKTVRSTLDPARYRSANGLSEHLARPLHGRELAEGGELSACHSATIISRPTVVLLAMARLPRLPDAVAVGVLGMPVE